ncbi:MAG: PEP-CTERM sorting domain-containing protein [Puniceicoccales bacterium]
MNHLITTTIALTLSASAALAGLQTSGSVNIDIPGDFTGVFIDIQTGSFSTVDDSDFQSSDVNFFFGGSGVANGPSFQPVRTGVGNLDPIANLAPGTVVDSSLLLATGFGGSENTHIGLDLDQFQLGEVGFLGFHIDIAGELHYGCMRVDLGNVGEPGMVLDWVYNDTPGMGVTVVPEPGHYAMIIGLAGISALAVYRRKRKFAA